MLIQPRTPTTLVPYTIPPISYLKLQDYIKSLSYVAYWPLDDAANNPFQRVFNPAVAVGRQLVIDGDMEAVGTAAWTALSAAALSKQAGAHDGSQCLRIARAGTTNPGARQTILTIGRVYQLTGWCRGDGAGTMIPQLVSPLTVLGTNSNTWQAISLTFIATTTTLDLRAATGTVDGQYCEFDSIVCKELNIPASDAVPIQLLNTDVWNGLGTAAWTAVNSATLSAQTTTRHDGASGTVLRILRNGVTFPLAKQTFLTVGQVYRVYGWARGTGGAGGVRVFTNGTSVTLFTGTNSTDWQPFDVLFVAVTTEISFGSNASVNGDYAEFDVTVVALDTGIRQGNVLVNSTTFPTDISSWVSANAAVLTWESDGAGGHCIRNTRAGTNGSEARQPQATTAGKRIWVTGEYRTNGASGLTANVVVSTGATTIFAGSNPIVWTAFSALLVVAGAGISLRVAGGASGDYAEWRNVVVSEISPLCATPVNGVVLGNVESNRLLVSDSFDGVNDLVQPLTTQLNSIFNPSSGTLMAFVYMPAFANGVAHYFVRLGVSSGTNDLRLRKDASNRFVVEFFANSVSSSVIFPVTLSGWHLFAVTWDTVADELKAYIDNNQVGATQTGLGVWVGNLTAAVCGFGAAGSAGGTPLAGKESHVALFNVALSAEQIAEIAKLGDAA